MAGLLGGVLPAIYSGADQLKRQIYGLLTNPNEMAQRAGQNLLQTHAENQALMSKAHGNPQNPLQITDPTAFSELTNRYMAGVTGVAPIGMIAYHGTPHTIQGKFDISKVGTGEGAQAYGHGMYFAEARPVAEEYAAMAHKNYFDESKGVEQIASQYWDMYKTPDKAIQALKAQIKPNLTPEAKKFTEDAIKVLEDKKGTIGNLYKVDIPDSQVPNMLDWDKPLSQQPEIAQKVKNIGDAYLSKIGILPDLTRRSTGKELTGSELYDALTTYNSQKGASNILANQGISGIRYLDQGSRGTTGGQIIDVFKDSDGWKSKIKIENRGGAGFMNPTDVFTTSMPFKTETEAKKWAEEKIGKGTSNFVVFDPTDVKILERNDKPLEGLLGN